MFSAMEFDQRKWRGQRRQKEDQVAAMIDLTNDSDEDQPPIELAARQVWPQHRQRTPKMQNSPYAGPQIHPQTVAAAHASPSRAGVNSHGSKIDENFRQDFEMADFVIDDFDDQMFIRALEEELQQGGLPQLTEASSVASSERPDRQDTPIMETRLTCIDSVVALFPGICIDYVSQLYDTVSNLSEIITSHILDKSETGMPYPTAQEKQKLLKRKRDIDEDEEAARRYSALDRVVPVTSGTTCVRGQIRIMLGHEFSKTPMAFIDTILNQSGYRLFPAYRILDEAQRKYDPLRPPYNKIRKPRPSLDTFNPQMVQTIIAAKDTELPRVELLRELQAARRLRAKADLKHQEQCRAELLEEENVRKAEAEGTMSECGCCYGDFPLNRMVHCDAETSHWFCAGCAYRNAETEIGNSRFELKCMSMEGCTAGFCLEQRSRFLDAKTTIALERNELEASLRLAGIENLASCPFCPYAAEYPPIEENREFRCQAPDCERVTCRLCKLESHIPKSCEENAKETGLSIRRQIEEAMSAAMIRNCNKCGCAFVKEEGCNKMTCTRNGCFNVQCYVCSKSCSYDHFDDQSRGGKKGNCPLFDSVDQRHDQEVKQAERVALDKIRAEHPEYTEEDLKVKVSDDVVKDDERRKSNPRVRLDAFRLAHRAVNDLQRVFYHNPRQVTPDEDVGRAEGPIPVIEREAFPPNDQPHFANGVGFIAAGAVPPPPPRAALIAHPYAEDFYYLERYMDDKLRQQALAANPVDPLPQPGGARRHGGQVGSQDAGRQILVQPQDKNVLPRKLRIVRDGRHSWLEDVEDVDPAAQGVPPAPAARVVQRPQHANPPIMAAGRSFQSAIGNNAILTDFQREIAAIDALQQQHAMQTMQANALAQPVQFAAPAGAYVNANLFVPGWIPAHVKIGQGPPQEGFYAINEGAHFHNLERELFRPENEGYFAAPVPRNASRVAQPPVAAQIIGNPGIAQVVGPANARQMNPEWQYGLDDWVKEAFM